jgi:DNA-directed RNA polymerase subunit RPC12/RpoP
MYQCADISITTLYVCGGCGDCVIETSDTS